MDLCSVKDLNELLSRHGFSFSRALGQNFLIAPWVPERIAEESGIDASCGVLEIGPGVGCLTRELAKRAGHVAAVELDRRLIPVLKETVGELENVSVICGDVMKADLTALSSEHFAGLVPNVCANLPYNITSPVITKLIESGLFSRLTVMIQREVARRICAVPGSGDYGAFTVFVNFYGRPRHLFDVPPSCFRPMPKVTSSVISIDMRDKPAADVDPSLFFRVVRGAFGKRRKTLLNSVSSVLAPEVDRELVTAAMEACGIGPQTRGEELDIPAFAALAAEIGRCSDGD